MRKSGNLIVNLLIKQEAVICEFFGKKKSLHYVNCFSRTDIFGTFGFLIQIGLCVMVNYFKRI